jgi:hypothetical protein
MKFEKAELSAERGVTPAFLEKLQELWRKHPRCMRCRVTLRRRHIIRAQDDLLVVCEGCAEQARLDQRIQHQRAMRALMRARR